jgi:hypothetical protein
MTMVLLEAGAVDPLAMILQWGAASISGLVSIVLLFLLSRLTRIEGDIKSVAENMIGRDGLAIKFERLRGEMDTAKSEISALKTSTLTREIFERETSGQNKRLEDLKTQTREVEQKVDHVAQRLPRTYSPYPEPPRGPGRPK